MKQHAWILAAGLMAAGLQPARAQEARLAPLPDTPVSTMVSDTVAEAATLPGSQRWRTWMGLSIRLLARMTEARRAGDTAAFADLARAYEEAMRNAAQAARSAGAGRQLALRHVDSAIGRHRAVLEGFLDRVPTAARVHVEQSIMAADNSQDVVLAALGGEGETVAAGTVEVTPDTPAVVTPPVVGPAGAAPADVTVVAPQDVEPTRPAADTPTRRTRRAGTPGTAPAAAAPVVPGVASPVAPAPVVPGVAPVVPVVPSVGVPVVPGVNVPAVPGVNTPLRSVPNAVPAVPAVPGVNVPAVPGVNVPVPGVVPNRGTIPNIRGGFSPNLVTPSPLARPAPQIGPGTIGPGGPGVAPGGAGGVR